MLPNGCLEGAAGGIEPSAGGGIEACMLAAHTHKHFLLFLRQPDTI